MRTDLTLVEALTIAQDVDDATRHRRRRLRTAPVPTPAGDKLRNWLSEHPYTPVLTEMAPWSGHAPSNPAVERFLQWSARMRGVWVSTGRTEFSVTSDDPAAVMGAFVRLVTEHGRDDVERQVDLYLELVKAEDDEANAEHAADMAAERRFFEAAKAQPERLLIAFLGHCGWWMHLKDEDLEARSLRAEAGLHGPPPTTIETIATLASRSHTASLVDYAMDVAGSRELRRLMAEFDDPLAGLTVVSQYPFWIEGLQGAIAAYGPDRRLDGRLEAQPAARVIARYEDMAAPPKRDGERRDLTHEVLATAKEFSMGMGRSGVVSVSEWRCESEGRPMWSVDLEIREWPDERFWRSWTLDARPTEDQVRALLFVDPDENSETASL